MADSFFAELKRRNVFKVGVAYLVLAWVVIQIADVIVPALSLPDWTITFLVVMGMFGFPFALFFAWAFEITPEGIKKESEITPEESITAHTGRKLDFTIIGLLVIALGYFIYESRFESQLKDDVVTEEISTETEPEPVKDVSKEPENSTIAVLPFVNMSSDTEQEYFSDGITEELLNALAKIPSLQVTSRTSSFAYKGKDINIAEVAQKLGVRNVLEGSVRKSGNKIRITAQLIDASTDKHLWSETYDRELIDIFAIQDEISASIVTALKLELDLDIQLAEFPKKLVNEAAQNEYWKGRYLLEQRTEEKLEQALLYFDKAITIAPDYALAWTAKAQAILFLSELAYGTMINEKTVELARPIIEMALKLDSELPEAQAVMGIIFIHEDRHSEAAKYFRKAIELKPSYADAYAWLGSVSIDPEESLTVTQKAVKLSPLSIKINSSYADRLSEHNLFDEAEKVIKFMQLLDKNSQFIYRQMAEMSFDKKQWGTVAYYRMKLFEKYMRVGTFFRWLGMGMDLDLGEAIIKSLDIVNDHLEAVDSEKEDLFSDLGISSIKAYIEKNFQLHNDLVRKIYPRQRNDLIGSMIRANAELYVENYKEAIKYYERAFMFESTEIVYCYQQIGDTADADAIIADWKGRYEERETMGINYGDRSDLGKNDMKEMPVQIAFAEGDMTETIKQLNLRLDNDEDYILYHFYTHWPMYQKLREHPDWLVVTNKSNKKINKYRDNFLKLVAE